MYRLYGYPTQNTKKVVYVLNELGIDFEYQPVDLAKGEQKKDDFSKKTPIGKVPLLQHDEEYLFESGAICRYLANVANSPLYPENKLARARVDQWMDYFTSHLGRWFNTLYFETIIKPMRKELLGEPDKKTCDEALKFIEQQAKITDDWLSHNRYFLGETFTIADLFGYAYVEQYIPCKVSLDAYPNLKRWLDEVGSRNSIKKSKYLFEQ